MKLLQIDPSKKKTKKEDRVSGKKEVHIYIANPKATHKTNIQEMLPPAHLSQRKQEVKKPIASFPSPVKPQIRPT